VQSYLIEMINERKLSDGKDERMDLLSNLVNANDEVLEDGEQKLGEVELIGRGSGLGLPVHSLTRLTFSEYLHVLRRWTRSEYTITNTDHLSTSTAR
jgi:hypothetical protein